MNHAAYVFCSQPEEPFIIYSSLYHDPEIIHSSPVWFQRMTGDSSLKPNTTPSITPDTRTKKRPNILPRKEAETDRLSSPFVVLAFSSLDVVLAT
jgi:hypothetical protein